MRVGLVEQGIIDCLGSYAPQSAEQLRLSLLEININVTRQAVFDALRKLRRAVIVIKVGRDYSLSVPWLFEESDRIESFISVHTNPQYLSRYLDLAGDTSSWSFNSLLRLKVFWSNLVLSCARMSSSNDIVSWNPHPWFYLVLESHEAGVVTALRKLGKRMYKFVGGDTCLDRVANKCWSSEVVEARFGVNPLRLSSNRYMSIIPPYILTATISRYHARELELIYQRVRNYREFDQIHFLEILKHRGKSKLNLEVDLERATMLVNRFKCANERKTK